MYFSFLHLQVWTRSLNLLSRPPSSRRCLRKPRNSRKEEGRRRSREEETCPTPWRACPSTTHRLRNVPAAVPHRPLEDQSLRCHHDDQGTFLTLTWNDKVKKKKNIQIPLKVILGLALSHLCPPEWRSLFISPPPAHKPLLFVNKKPKTNNNQPTCSFIHFIQLE